MPKTANIARTDIPAKEDLLSFTDKAEGLAAFIQSCPTPMTLAIQGGWGSGKSTMIQLVLEKLDKKSVRSIKIETWKFAHIAAEEDIPAAFAAEVYQQLFRSSREFQKDQIKKSLPEKVKRVLGAISPTVRKNTEKFLLDSEVKGSASSTLLSVATGVLFDLAGENLQKQDELQKDFKEVFSETLKDISGDKTFAIFVDDLDRLPPARAVQIMETIKLFFETEKCVFILAIDFDVVQKGARAIYGDSMDEVKAKQFFDKIIQVPFNVPSPGGEVKNLIVELLADLKSGKKRTLKNADKFADLSQQLLFSNPRSIKRVANSMMLLKLITEKADRSSNDITKVFEDDNDLLYLYWLLCIQVTDFKLANEITEDLSDDNPPKLQLVLQADDGDDEEADSGGTEIGDVVDEIGQEVAVGDLNPWLAPIGNTGVNALSMLRDYGGSESTPPTASQWHERFEKVVHLARLTAVEATSANKGEKTGIGIERTAENLDATFVEENKPLTIAARKQIDEFAKVFGELDDFDKYFYVENGPRRIRIRLNQKYSSRINLRGNGVFYLRYPRTGKYWLNFNHPSLHRVDFLSDNVQTNQQELEEKICSAVGFEIMEALPRGAQNGDSVHVEVITNDAFISDFRVVQSINPGADDAKSATRFMKAYLEFIIREIEGDPQKAS